MNYKTLTSLTCLMALAIMTHPAQAQVTATSSISQLSDYAATSIIARESHLSTAPDISRDGSTIVFTSTADLVPGSNPKNLENIYIMKPDGTGLRQLTAAVNAPENTSIENTVPRVSADGKVVVFASPYNLTGENPPEFFANLTDSQYSYYVHYYQIFIINSNGTDLRQLTHGNGWHSLRPRISDDGRIIAFESTQDLITGQNSDHTSEIFVINADGTGLAQITRGGKKPPGRNIRGDESRNAAISGDGTTVAFDSLNDLLPPSNDDWSNEVFVFDLARYRSERATISDLAGYTVQITDTDVDDPFHVRSEEAFEPSLSYDGAWIVFAACINPNGEGIGKPGRTVLGDNPLLPDVIFIARRDGSGLRQLTFSDDPNAYVNDPDGWKNRDDDAHWPVISADGARVVFGTRSRADLALGSRPYEYEIAMVDLNAPPGNNGRPVVTQLTFGSTYVARLRPSINADASLITLHAESDFTGGNPDKNSEVFLITPLAAAAAPPATTPPVVTPAATAPATSDADSTSSSTASGGGGTIGLMEALFGIAALGGGRLIRRRRTIP